MEYDMISKEEIIKQPTGAFLTVKYIQNVVLVPTI